MSFQVESNRKRAQKIVEILGHVERSAKANRATSDEIAAMLAPAINALRAIDAIPSAISLPPLNAGAEAADITAKLAPAPKDIPGGAWGAESGAPAFATIRDLAASAPLADLTTAMAVFLSRIDEELSA